jgi:DMSO/TMAO reductase YedYZ molybdopterin-dependent catalytic subunit
MSQERKIVTAAPENSETPLEQARGWVTPNHLFFVRNHFEPPAIDLKTWRLRVEGCVDHAIEWTFAELLDLPERTVFATVECAGNGRSFLAQRVSGVQWGAGAIGHAEWTGVPLKVVLERSKVQASAIEILFEGADQGTEPDHPEPMRFARSLPLEKALHPDTLLATRMNGELLEAVHGAPVRLFVPGWYGVAAVKWLARIAAIDKPFGGYFQSKKYTYQRRAGEKLDTKIVGPMVVKSEILRPREGEVLGIGTNRIAGLAWAGEEAIAQVDISTDSGATWAPADLVGPQAPYSWNLWEYLWEQPRPGSYTILARARSKSGHVQPTEYDPLFAGYMIHFSRPLIVQLTADTRSAARTGNVEALMFDINAYAEENRRMALDVDVQYCEGSGI